MKFLTTKLPGVLIIEPDVLKDSRGFFFESYHRDKFAAQGLAVTFVQDNHSRSVKNTLRGLHLQLKHPQGKLIRVLRGEIFDVAVDVRVGSPTFGQWIGTTLSADNFRQMYVPPGFAHGFIVLSESADTLYKCTDIYYKEGEHSIQWNDPDIGVQWPAPHPILSPKDQDAPRLHDLIPVLSQEPAYRV